MLQLKHFRNFMLHDVTDADHHEEFLFRPGGYLRKALMETNSTSREEFYHVDFNLPLVVDDGHYLGLGNPQILRHIFKFLRIPDLLRARLVNLRWNVIACELLREKLGYQGVRPSLLKSFTKLMKKNITNPFCSYAIRIDEISAPNVKAFLNRFALEIANLRVRLNITELIEFARFLQKMKNLKQLHIIIFDEGNYRNSHLVVNDLYHGCLNAGDETLAWKTGLYSFDKVSTIILESTDESYKIHPFYDRVVSNMINACSNLKTLKFTDWNSPLGRLFYKLGIDKPGIVDICGKAATTEELTTLFFTTSLKFSVVRIEVTTSVPFELVSDVIHKSGDSLRDLSVVNQNIFEKFSISSVLRHLGRLRLNLWFGPVDFSFVARQFPALRVLSLNLSNLFELELEKGVRSLEPCKSLRTLILTRLETGIDTFLMEKLANLFPYVKELFVEVKDGEVAEKIYEVYPELSLLCLELNNSDLGGSEPMTNQSFTGVADDDVNVMHYRECGCPVVEFPEEARSCWNIGCLRNLTTLLLRVPNTVNNIALLEGISRLEKLENLCLLPFYYSDQTPTKWCLRSIADNFRRLRTLVTSTEIEYPEEDVHYLLKKLPKLIHKTKL